MWRWVAFGSGFLRFFFAAKHSFPYPQSLFRRQRLGDEKKILWRTALPENGNGHQVSFFATPAFIEQLERSLSYHCFEIKTDAERPS